MTQNLHLTRRFIGSGGLGDDGFACSVFSAGRGDSKRIRTSVSSLAVLREGHFCELDGDTRFSFLN